MRYSENFQGLFSCQTQDCSTRLRSLQRWYGILAIHDEEDVNQEITYYVSFPSRNYCTFKFFLNEFSYFRRLECLHKLLDVCIISIVFSCSNNDQRIRCFFRFVVEAVLGMIHNR